MEEAAIAFLQLGWESAICSVGSQGHLASYCEGGTYDESSEGCGHLSEQVVVKSSEVGLPSGVELSVHCDFETHVEECAEQRDLSAIFHGLVEGLQVDDCIEPSPRLSERSRRLVVLGEQFGAVDEVTDILLEVCG